MHASSFSGGKSALPHQGTMKDFRRVCSIVCLCLGLHLVAAQGEDGPIVDTIYGQVQGASQTDDQARRYDEFLGIPFATPPVGDLRWRKPLPPKPWQGVYNATQYGYRCVQVTLDLPGDVANISEDCLYLNVFVPIGVQELTDREQKLPVMVYIHGGGYIIGSGERYPAWYLALHGQVIVVTINYRLGPLGFLSTEDSVAPGNYGLWDTHAACKWVQENIDSFGGDQERVTVFGQSAGAGLASHTVISPQMEGIVHRVIGISGSSTGWFGYNLPGKSLQAVQALADVFDCPTNDSQEMMDCLMDEDAEDVYFWGMSVLIGQGMIPNWMPVVDGDFVVQRPNASWEAGVGANIDFMTGRTYQDGAGFVLGNVLGIPDHNATINGTVVNGTYGVAEDMEVMQLFLRLQLGYTADPDKNVQLLMDRYPGLRSNDTATRGLTLTRVVTDGWFSSSAHFEAASHSRSAGNGSTYLYQFQHSQSFLGYPDWVNGSHSDDLYSVFGDPFNKAFRAEVLGKDFDEVDKEVNKNIMTLYANFAHTGNPNLGPAGEAPAIWPQYDTTSRQYFQQAPSMYVETETQDMVDEYNYWNYDFPAFLQQLDLQQKPEERSSEEEMMHRVGLIREYWHLIHGWDSEATDLIEDTINEAIWRRKTRNLDFRKGTSESI